MSTSRRVLHADSSTRTSEQRRIALLEGEVAALRERLTASEAARAALQRAYMDAMESLRLLQRRVFAAKAERNEAVPEQLAFDAMLAHVKTLEAALAKSDDAGAGGDGSDDPTARDKTRSKPSTKPKGRRDLHDSDLPIVRVEITDPTLEGKAERIGFEESSRLGYERGGMRHIVVARVVYKVDPAPETTSADATQAASPSPACIVTAPLPRELFRRTLLAPAMIAHLLVSKYMMGVPFHRLEQKFALEGVTLDRGTMCRYAEDAGATLGEIVEVVRAHVMARAFCLSTDATGVRIQPGPIHERPTKSRGPCRKGHFFVVLADRDHVFFEYQPKHDGDTVCEMFKGFTGYIQADAHSIYNTLFRGEAIEKDERGRPRAPPPTEVGCWSHARRYFWEAAVSRHALGVEGLRRINALFAAERAIGDVAPSVRKVRREQLVRPVLDSFFAWLDDVRRIGVEGVRLSDAFGYAHRHRIALSRFLDDGRLRLENNASERQLRTIAVGRKAWLFFGHDDNASAAANLYSLIASCKLHGLDPERYFTDVIRVMRYFDRSRYLELAPMNWTRTRARLDDREMNLPYGPVTVPPPLPAEEQTPTN